MYKKMPTEIYIVQYLDKYCGYEIAGYFAKKEKADLCCRYYGETACSDPEHAKVIMLSEDTRDYALLIQQREEALAKRREHEEEMKRRRELNMLAYLKKKYEYNGEMG